MLSGIVLGMAWFTVFVIAHALFFHLRSVRKRFQAILNLFVSPIAAQAISCVIVAVNGSGTDRRCPDRGVRARRHRGHVLGLGAVHALLLRAAASTSIRTLIAVQHAPRGELSVAQLMARFASPSILRHR